MKKFWLYVAETSGARIYGVLAASASLVLTARLLGPSGRGVVAAVNAWVALFSGLAALSLGQVAIYQASNNPEEGWFRKALGTLIVVDIALSLLTGMIVAVMWAATKGNVFGHLPLLAFAVGFAALPFQIWEGYGSNLLMAINQLRIYNKGQMVGRTVALIFVYVLVGWFRVGIIGAIWASVLSQLSVSAFGFRTLWHRAGGKPQFDMHELVSLLKGGAKLHLNAIGFVLFTQADIVMLNHYRTKAEVGWYQFALQLITMLLIIPSSTSVVLFGRMGQVGANRLWPEQKKMGLYLLGGMTALGVAAYFLAPWLIPLVAGRSFAPSVPLLRGMLPVMLGLTLSIFMTNQWIGRGLFLQAAALSVFYGLGILGLNALLIPRFGTMGAIYAALIVNVGFVAISTIAFVIWIDRRHVHATAVTDPETS